MLREIEARLDAVAWFAGDKPLRQNVRAALARMPDMARAAARLTLRRGGPRDLSAIGQGLGVALDVAALVSATRGLTPLPEHVRDACRVMGHDAGDLAASIGKALAADLPLTAGDGGFIARGYRSDLDEERMLRDDHRRVIVGLQASYAAQTGIKSLKIKHNNILGYFVEVSAQNAPALGRAKLRDCSSIARRSPVLRASRPSSWVIWSRSSSMPRPAPWRSN